MDFVNHQDDAGRADLIHNRLEALFTTTESRCPPLAKLRYPGYHPLVFQKVGDVLLTMCWLALPRLH